MCVSFFILNPYKYKCLYKYLSNKFLLGALKFLKNLRMRRKWQEIIILIHEKREYLKTLTKTNILNYYQKNKTSWHLILLISCKIKDKFYVNLHAWDKHDSISLCNIQIKCN